MLIAWGISPGGICFSGDESLPANPSLEAMEGSYCGALSVGLRTLQVLLRIPLFGP